MDPGTFAKRLGEIEQRRTGSLSQDMVLAETAQTGALQDAVLLLAEVMRDGLDNVANELHRLHEDLKKPD